MALKELKKQSPNPAKLGQDSIDAQFDQIITGNRNEGYNPADELPKREKDAGEKNNESQPDEDLASRESAPTHTHTVGNMAKQAGKAVARRSFGPIIGIASMVVLSSLVVFLMLGPGMMMRNILQNLSIHNDFSERSMNRRLVKNVEYILGDASEDPICNAAKVSKTVKCTKQGKPTNKFLNQLHKKGITAYYDGGGSYDGTAKKGSPTKKIAGWSIKMDDGKVINVNKKDLIGFLFRDNSRESRKLQAKVLGKTGAFSMRALANQGKWVTKLYNRFGLERKGGLAQKGLGKLSARQAAAWLEKKLPAIKTFDSHIAKLQQKIGGKIRLGRFAGAGYSASLAYCMSIKIPAFIASGVGAVEAEIVTQTGMSTLLSPASMATSNFSHNNFTADASETAHSVLTTPTLQADGSTGAAIDSSQLLFDMGVSRTGPTVSSYAPGFEILNNPLIKAGTVMDATTEPYCNEVMSPQAMYSALALNIAIKAIQAGTGAGIVTALAQTGAEMIASEFFIRSVQGAAENGIRVAMESLSRGETLSEAVLRGGTDLGTISSLGATLILARLGAHRGIPVLTMSQINSVTALNQQQRDLERERDIASLSPFDTSSQYTFLGSIVHNFQNTAIASGLTQTNVASIFSNIMRLPSLALSSNIASADDEYMNEQCKYASAWGRATDDPETTPAIMSNGAECRELPAYTEGMSVKEARDLVSEWINHDVNIPDDADIQDLMQVEYIKKDTPLWMWASQCMAGVASVPGESEMSDITDYITDSAGCTIVETGSSLQYETDATLIPIETRKLMAVPVFLLDFQIQQSILGNDDDESAASAGTSNNLGLTGNGTDVNPDTWAVDANHNGNMPPSGSPEWVEWVNLIGGNGVSSTGVLTPINVGYEVCPQSNSLNQNGGGNFFNANAAASATALIQAFNDAHPGKYLTPGACFRSRAGQDLAWERFQKGGNEAATPGTSNHGWGVAIDLRVSTSPGSPGVSVDSFSSPEYLWLKNNSYNYGWINPLRMRPEGGCRGSGCEPWHFQYVGGL